MSTKPRTPEHFPKMKHRAAGRPYRLFGSAIKRLSKTLEGAAREFRKMGEAAFTAGENFQALDALVACRDETCSCEPTESVVD